MRIFAPPDIAAEQRSDGTWVLRSRTPLEPYERSVGAVLARQARDRPDADLLCERDADGNWRRASYGQAWQAARAIGQALLDRGLGPERPVMILSGNSVDHGLVTLGGFVAGVPVVPVSAAYSLQSADFSTLAHVVRRARPGLVYVGDVEPHARALAAVDLGWAEVVASVPDERATPLAELLATTPTKAIDAAAEAVGPDTVAKVLFTSGSTGPPKGVLTTHRMLCCNQQMTRQVWPFTTEEPVVLVDWLPWSHTFGGSHDVGLVLWSGGTLYIDAGRPAPGLIETTLANLAEISPTAFFSVPAGFAALLPRLEADAGLAERFFANLRLILYAGAALPQASWDRLDALARRAVDRPIPFTASWGSTETAPMATTAHFPLDGPGCIGVPVPGVTVKLVPTERTHELRVKGPNVTPGYLGEPEITAAAFDDEGFYRMGDAGRFLDPEHPERGIVFDGRVAEDFKLATGTWVNVGTVRTALVSAGAGLIRDAVLTGHDGPEVGALVWLTADDPEGLRVAVEKHNAAHPQSSARIGRVLVLADPPSIDAQEITDKGYVNQRAVLAHRAGEVARLHREDGPEVLVFPAM
ncbi:MAG TPA: feruloyl-CoA synthase [Acidimicrobiales bacterium]|nr:feruloyl-CoA synthase [Acidimicrobiales bacterium]